MKTRITEDSKRVLGRVLSSPYKSRIIEALMGTNDGLPASTLMQKSGALSDGSFFYHLRDLERLNLISHNSDYTLTEFGHQIAQELSNLYLNA